jgi:phenylalanyl-tRNA synthetase beta chain
VEPRTIRLRVEKTNRFLGTTLTGDEMAGYLRSLEMQVEPAEPGVLQVTPPALRVDITREVDLMEEVARLEGYDRIPVTAPPVHAQEEKDDPIVELGDRLRGIMTGSGFTEIISYSFISPDSADLLGAGPDSPLRSFVKILNPLSQDQSVMRTSLLPGLLTAARLNFSHGEKDLRLFEWGKTFFSLGGDELPREVPVLAGILTGLAQPKEWFSEERGSDFFDCKGTVQGLLKGLKVEPVRFRNLEGAVPGYDPEGSAAVYVSDTKVGVCGAAAPEVMARADLEGDQAFLFEIDLESLKPHIPAAARFEPFARFPAVYRDLSIVVSTHVESERIGEIILREGQGLAESVDLYDLFRGGKLGPGEKALAFRITYRSKEGTLDGKEVNRIHERIVESIGRETGGRLRER